MANLTKQQLRLALRPLVGQDIPLNTTQDGAVDGDGQGITVIDEHYNGADVDYFTGMYILIDGGTHAGKYRPITETSSVNPKTFTVTPPFGLGAVVGGEESGILGELHSFSPTLYTKALNLAIIDTSARRLLFKAALNSSLTIINNQVAYTLPVGYTRDNIIALHQEGEGDYDEIPYIPIRNYRYDPTGVILWLNGRPNMRRDTLYPDRKLYITAELPLSLLDTDTPLGIITTDTTPKVELTANTDAWLLLLDFARAKFYELLAAEPSYGQRVEALALAKAFYETALASAKTKAMPPLTVSSYF